MEDITTNCLYRTNLTFKQLQMIQNNFLRYDIDHVLILKEVSIFDCIINNQSSGLFNLPYYFFNLIPVFLGGVEKVKLFLFFS
jgi:hypothetical protein